LPSLSSFKGYGNNFFQIRKVELDNIPSLTNEGIQIDDDSFKRLRVISSSNSDSLDRFIRQRSKQLNKVNTLESDSSGANSVVDYPDQFTQEERISPRKRIRIKRNRQKGN
ncbi:hypothetical protein WA171_004323, partial [Blastocystis sp. BT1]